MSNSQDDLDPKVLGENSGVYIPNEGKSSPLSIDLGGFAVGLYQSALMSLGKLVDPESGQSFKDLDSARHTIDILVMLQQKTKGNLDEEEDQLIQSLIRELKLAYIEVRA